MPEHILLREEGSGRFNPTSYSLAAFLPAQGCAGIRQRCGGWAGKPGPCGNREEELMVRAFCRWITGHSGVRSSAFANGRRCLCGAFVTFPDDCAPAQREVDDG